MNAKVVNAVLNAIMRVFSSMYGMKTIFEKPAVSRQLIPEHEVIGIIGITGDLFGNVVYSMKKEAVFAMVRKIAGMDITEIDELALSAVGEMTNIVAGNMATLLTEIGYKLDITPPSVIYGKELKIKVEGFVIKIPGKLDELDFDVSIVVKEENKEV